MEKSFIEKLGISDGPWQAITDNRIDKRGNPHIIGKYEKIAIVKKAVNDRENADLLAAAPAMLEALICGVIALDSEMSGMIWENVQFDKDNLNALRKMIDAIESATGKTWEEIRKILGGDNG